MQEAHLLSEHLISQAVGWVHDAAVSHKSPHFPPEMPTRVCCAACLCSVYM